MAASVRGRNGRNLGAALRYVAQNPLRARLVERAVDWRWSSVHALLRPDVGDGLTTTAPVLSRYPDIAGLIAAGEDEALSRTLRRAETIGRPLGTADCLARLEAEAGRVVSPAKLGPKARVSELSRNPSP